MPDSNPTFTMSPTEFEALHNMLFYFWTDESADYDASEPEDQENHIFVSMQTLKTWLDANMPAATADQD